jgi:nicotinate-nucleotide adenylyltransferase
MIGVFGGTFDPIHNGHAHIAAAAIAELDLEQLLFVPCAEPVHRPGARASAEQRCAMIELALSGQPRMRLDRIEIERGGPSYTVDTLRELGRQNDDVLLLLLGADAFNGFGSWKSPAEILRLANLAICIRPGTAVDRDSYAGHRVASAASLKTCPAGGILLLEVGAPDCSSSSVRAALDAGDIPISCLHPDVADYIRQRHLYRRTGD